MDNGAPRRRGAIDARAWVTGAVGAVFLFAAIGKALDPKPLMDSLVALIETPLGNPMKFTIVAGLAGIEVALGVIVVFTALVTKLVVDPSAPPCGCAGVSLLSDDAQTSNAIALGRNALLIGCCGWLAAPARGM